MKHSMDIVRNVVCLTFKEHIMRYFHFASTTLGLDNIFSGILAVRPINDQLAGAILMLNELIATSALNLNAVLEPLHLRRGLTSHCCFQYQFVRR